MSPKENTMDTTTPKKRTITMTGRPPVSIVENDWPIIASAKWHDGKVESQANRSSWLKVRQHADGRTLVYGGYDNSWQHERDLRAGELLIPDDGRTVDGAQLAAAIRRVAAAVKAEEIADDCIGDLPPDDI